MTSPAPLEPWTEERVIIEVETIAASWHTYLGPYRVMNLRDEILTLVRRVLDADRARLAQEAADLTDKLDSAIESYRTLRTEANTLLQERDKAEAQLEAARAEMAEGLAMPDSPGWWAYIESEDWRYPVEIAKWGIEYDVVTVRYAHAPSQAEDIKQHIKEFLRQNPGTWTRLHMPWNKLQRRVEGEGA